MIIDSDNPYIHSSCEGRTCDELVEAAEQLGLNLGVLYLQMQAIGGI